MPSIQQHPRASTSTLPPFSHYQPQSSSRPRLTRKDSPPPLPTHALHRVPSNGSSSSSHLLSLLHPERSHPISAPIPRRLQTSPLILCEVSPFHKRALSSSPTDRMTPLPELAEEEGEKMGVKCGGKRSAEKMRMLADGWLFPPEEREARKYD